MLEVERHREQVDLPLGTFYEVNGLKIWIKYAFPIKQKGTLAKHLSNVRRCWLAMPLDS